MKTTDNGRALARSRANQRLRNLTIGTAVFGVAATGGLGWLAAMSNDGSTAGVTTAVVTTTANDTSTTTTATSTGVATTAAPVVTAAGGTAHATTGGS